MTARVTVARGDEEVEVDRTITIRLGDKVVAEDWSWSDLTYAEAESIEAAYGSNLFQVRQDISAGSKTAERILLWALLRRDDPKLKLADVNPKIGEFEVDVEDVDVESDPLDPTQASADATGPTPSDG